MTDEQPRSIDTPCEQPAAKKPQRSQLSRGLKCFAINCQSYRNQISRAAGVSFHLFPNKESRPEQYKLWFKNCGRSVEPSKASRLCSKHFADDMINRTLGRIYVKDYAVPTKFDIPKYIQHKFPIQKKGTMKRKAREFKEKLLTKQDSGARTLVSLDHSYQSVPDANNPKLLQNPQVLLSQMMLLKPKMLVLRRKNQQLKKALRNASIREKRAKQTSKQLQENLEEKNFQISQLERQLASYKDIPCELLKKPINEYSEDQRNFALTLYLYSPKAYDYLRETVNMALPAPRSLRRWYGNHDGEPGPHKSVIEAMCLDLAENPTDETIIYAEKPTDETIINQESTVLNIH